ncbi:MAG: hypothetical protein KGO05_03145, partial [Chloroflexota bacterium]|nr:hypothetical protein [Chloroflexota bacterium]
MTDHSTASQRRSRISHLLNAMAAGFVSGPARPSMSVIAQETRTEQRRDDQGPASDQDEQAEERAEEHAQ